MQLHTSKGGKKCHLSRKVSEILTQINLKTDLSGLWFMLQKIPAFDDSDFIPN